MGCRRRIRAGISVTHWRRSQRRHGEFRRLRRCGREQALYARRLDPVGHALFPNQIVGLKLPGGRQLLKLLARHWPKLLPFATVIISRIHHRPLGKTKTAWKLALTILPYTISGW